MEQKNKDFTKTMQIGITCICAYLVRYYMANILSVTSPEILQMSVFTKKFLGVLSSSYMFLYAVGQLINGLAGDIVKPKKMIVLGMIFCGISSILFSTIHIPVLKIIFYAGIGFFLSMLRGPLVKIISENTTSAQSRVICTFFSFSSFAGPLLASFISMFFDWKNTFIIAGIMAIIIGFAAYLIFTSFEKKGQISYTLSKNSNGFKTFSKVFRLERFKFYMYIVILTEFTSAVINFWVPTYISEGLGLAPNVSKSIFSGISFIKSFTPFISLFFFNLLKEKDIKMMYLSFTIGALFILGMRFITITYINILCVLLAQISIGAASALIWSIYIPSQKNSGMVSGINGILDFTGYLFASIATIVFSRLIEPLGWNAIIMIWFFIALSGALVSFIMHKKKRSASPISRPNKN